VFERRLSPVELLSEQSMIALERGWQRLVSEIGIQFQHEGVCDLFRAAGQRVEDDVVKFDPEWVLEQVRKAPSSFTLRARNPAKSLDFGLDRMAFCACQSAPFVREDGVRRNATHDDFRNLVRLTQVIDELDTPGYPICEPADLDVETRHLDLQLTLATETDKPFAAAQFDPIGCSDSIAMAAIVHGGLEAIAEQPALFGVINANSPLRFDGRMLDSLLVLARARQVVVVTPFILMGAMGPVSVPASLAQQTAESLTGIALAQLVSPGCPAIMGSFVSHSNMQSGSPGFGGPESAIGLLASGQIARRYGLLWRSGGGGLTSSQLPDAQGAFEALNTMVPAFLAGANLVMHTAGWLDSGLVACYEKFLLDVEALRILQRELVPLEIDDESLAFGAHEEIGHGGYFFGAAHTLERFRECFYRPMIFTTDGHDRWKNNGALDAAARANGKWRELIAEYEAPPLDDAVRDELHEYVARRRPELAEV
jgi:trimethylamine---corrinoid protein Co-methyltransferase